MSDARLPVEKPATPEYLRDCFSLSYEEMAAKWQIPRTAAEIQEALDGLVELGILERVDA